MSNVVTTTRRSRAATSVLIACALTVAVAACGSSSSSSADSPSSSTSSANTLLRQTFQGKHPTKSGTLSVKLEITPAGSSILKTPITLSFGGPFEAGGNGQLPQSDFTINATLQGQNLDLAIISAGGNGYITADGASYELPESDYKKLEGGFSSVVGGATSKSSTPLSSLGIDPLDWLGDAKVVGTPTIDGTATTQISSTVNVKKMLQQVSKLLGHASVFGLSGTGLPTKLTASETAKLTALLGKPDFNVWTGTSDHTIRKLTVTDKLPVTGSASTQLGSMTSAGVDLSFSYGDLNQPQTITAPTNLKPYKQFEQKVQSLLGTVSGIASETGSTSTSTEVQTTTVTGSSDAAYSACVAKAGKSVVKLQKCASKL